MREPRVTVAVCEPLWSTHVTGGLPIVRVTRSMITTWTVLPASAPGGLALELLSAVATWLLPNRERMRTRPRLKWVPSVEEFEATAGRGVSARVDGRRVLVGRAAYLQDNGVDVSPLRQRIGDHHHALRRECLEVDRPARRDLVVALRRQLDDRSLLVGPLEFARDAVAQASLGYMYEYGRGVTRDRLAAVRWYRMAAAQGDQNARQALALVKPPTITRYSELGMAVVGFIGGVLCVVFLGSNIRAKKIRRLAPRRDNGVGFCFPGTRRSGLLRFCP